MYLFIVFLFLFGSFVVGFFGCFLGLEGIVIMIIMCVLFFLILFLIVFYEVVLGVSVCYLRIVLWILLEMFDVFWGFFGDCEVIG